MKKYLYKNIVCYQTYGRWYSLYKDGKRVFGLDGSSLSTKADAYKVAKEMVDYLNSKEEQR